MLKSALPPSSYSLSSVARVSTAHVSCLVETPQCSRELSHQQCNAGRLIQQLLPQPSGIGSTNPTLDLWMRHSRQGLNGTMRHR